MEAVGHHAALERANTDKKRYYVWSPEANESKVVVFVTESQARALIEEVDRWFPSLNIRVPNNDIHPGFTCDFPPHPYLRPHWLGESSSRRQYDWLEAEAPIFDMGIGHPPSVRSLEAFKAMMDEAVEVAKNKKKTANAVKKQERIAKQHDMSRQVRRAQRYLGLRSMNEPSGAYNENSSYLYAHTD